MFLLTKKCHFWKNQKKNWNSNLNLFEIVDYLEYLLNNSLMNLYLIINLDGQRVLSQIETLWNNKIKIQKSNGSVIPRNFRYDEISKCVENVVLNGGCVSVKSEPNHQKKVIFSIKNLSFSHFLVLVIF